MKRAMVRLLFLLVFLCIQTTISFATDVLSHESTAYQQEENTPQAADYDIHMDVNRLSFEKKDEVLVFTIVLTNTGDTELQLERAQHSLCPELSFEQQTLAPREQTSTTATYTVLERDVVQGTITGNLNIQMKNPSTQQIIEKQSGVILRKPVILPQFETRQPLPKSGLGSNLLLLFVGLSSVGLASCLLIQQRKHNKANR